MVRNAILQLLDSPKLISRKISVTEKSWNSHIVFQLKKVFFQIEMIF